MVKHYGDQILHLCRGAVKNFCLPLFNEAEGSFSTRPSDFNEDSVQKRRLEIHIDHRLHWKEDDGMRKRVSLYAMIFLAAIVCVVSALSPSHAAKLIDGQIRVIQANIRNSTDLSTKCLENHDMADQNCAIASSEFEKTGIQGFRQAAEIYGDAKSKFLETRKIFDDAWSQTQLGMENGSLRQVQEGTDIHKTGVEHFHEGIQLLNRAAVIFNQALSESHNTALHHVPQMMSIGTYLVQDNELVSVGAK
jgi:hypothetical protein